MHDLISRREALGRLGLLVGGALSASTVSALLAGCRAEKTPGHAFRALDREAQSLTETLVDLIIPDTDTPGARAAGVPEFIDMLLADWMTEEERADFLAGLAQIDARAQAEHGARFVDLAPEQQAALAAALDREAFGAAGESSAETEADAEAAERAQSGTDAMADAAEQSVGQPDTTAADGEEAMPFFATFKDLTIAGYYTSEVGATQELHWNPAPGRLDLDVPFSEIGRTWA